MNPISRSLTVRLAALALLTSVSACGAFEKKDESDGKETAGVKPSDPTNPVSPGGPTPGTTPDGKQASPLALTGALVTFKTCAEVEAYIEADEIASMRRQIDDQIKWMESRGDEGEIVSGSKAGSAEAPQAAESGTNTAADSASGSPSASAAPNEHTSTNNQVEGVEEGDFVKNDGTHVFHVSRGKLRISKSWPAAELALLSTLELEGRAFELLLDEEKHRLVVLANPLMTPEAIAEENAKYGGGAGGAEPMADVVAPGFPGGGQMPRYDWERVEVSTIDVADPAAPVITGKYVMRGHHLASRRIGASVRLVLQTWRPYMDGLKMWIDYPASEKMTKAQKIARLKSFIPENEALIKAKELKYWLNFDTDFKLATGGAKEPIVDLGTCSSVHAPSVAAQSGLTRVATINLDLGSIAETLLISHVDEVYASTDNLYLASRYWWWSSQQRDVDATFVHKFDLKDPALAPYVGSGRISGMPLNQFSFDEFEGRLRVAVTTTKYTPMDPVTHQWVAPVTTNRVVVLEQAGAELKEIGASEDLAPGERIMSARFRGPRGFIVTFRQVDPLFTLDLTDPAAPKVMGALKIPGFSSYLHFADETHLLAVGRSGTENGLDGGMQISLFDVADLANPKEVQKLVLGGETQSSEPDGFYSGSSFWSEALWDHKAFTYFASKKLLALPVTGYTYVSSPQYWWSKYESSLFVFSIDAEAGIKPVGKVAMGGLYDGAERDQDFWWSGARVNRSFFADDFVYAVSDFGVRAANVNDLGNQTPVGSVGYKCDQTCFERWYWWY